MSGTEKLKIIYWDACIYFAWLMNEEAAHGKERIDGIRQIVKENFERKAVIVTSTITFVEVMSGRLTAQQESQFKKSFHNQDHIARDVDRPIAMKARDFRQRFLSKGLKTIATPDAIHIATACIYGAQEFWTFDDGQKDKRSLGLLALNGDALIDGLKICKPPIPPEPPPTTPDLFLKAAPSV